jgi:hypothetical protein
MNDQSSLKNNFPLAAEAVIRTQKLMPKTLTQFPYLRRVYAGTSLHGANTLLAIRPRFGA